MRVQIASLALAVLFGAAIVARAADEVDANRAGQQPNTVSNVYKASTLMGMKVKNLAGENVGSIHDFVIDTPNGHIRYVALSVGGFLGIGDRLFAIPWKSFTMKHDSSGDFYVLNVDKDKLKNAPGFDKDHWPNMADPKFGADIDKYYGVHLNAEPTVKTSSPVK